MKTKQTPKFDLYGTLCKRPDRTTRKRQKTPQQSYFDAVRIVELQRLSGDTDTF